MQDVIEDSIVIWEPYHNGIHLYGRFSVEQWKQIAGDIHSDTEWTDFIKHYVNSVKCWILKVRETGTVIAFIYIFNEDGFWKTISIHGGGWENPLMYCRGYILLLEHLLNLGLKVRTYCHISNATAIRLDRAIGFVPYLYSDDEVFMWINNKRLKSSKIYKRFYKNKL